MTAERIFKRKSGSEQIPELCFVQGIYVLTGVSLTPVDDLSISADFARLKVLCERWRNRGEEEYRRWLKIWNNDRYRVSSYDAGYYLSESDARRALDVYAGDLNEGGSYDYFVLHSCPIGVIYPASMGDHFHLFRYNRETDEYLEVFWGAMEKYRYIMLHFKEPAMPFDKSEPCEHGWKRKGSGKLFREEGHKGNCMH